MSLEEDRETLLDALYERHLATGKRPSVVEAQMNYLPEWNRDRLFDAAQALESLGDILEPTGAIMYVDLSSEARKRAIARRNASAAGSTMYNIGSIHNSPIQHVAAGAHGVQNTSYQVTKNDLRAVIDTYRKHVEELKLDPVARRRADAQVATLEAQLQDEPDPTIVKAAGKSLKTIVEGAIGGAAGNVLANPAVWTTLLSLFS